MITIASPRETLKLAFKAGFIGDEDVWLDMLKARNVITRMYGEDEAKRLVNMINTSFVTVFERLRASIAEKIAE